MATHLELLEAALQAREHAYAAMSHSYVGAAVLAADGAVYQGANMEFTRYSDHAEQVAIHAALSAGTRKLVAVAVFAAPEGPPQEAHFHSKGGPCGNCRQVLFDLAGDLEIVRFRGRHDCEVFHLSNMLPHAHKRKWPELAPPPAPAQHADPLVVQALVAQSQGLPLRTGVYEGAAVQSRDGQIFRGSKMELSSFHSQAERMALAAAFMAGQRDIVRIALAHNPEPMNWDNLQAVHRLNPRVRVVHPDPTGKFIEQPVLDFIHYLTEHDR